MKWYRTIDENVTTPRILTNVISCSSISGPDIVPYFDLLMETIVKTVKQHAIDTQKKF